MLPGLLTAATTQCLVHPALEGPFLGDRHLPLHLQQLTGPQLGMERTDQLEAFQEHLHRSVAHSNLLIIQLAPVQLRIKAASVSDDLVLRQLTGLAQPAIGVAVETTPVQERIEIDRAPTQLNAVLLQTPLQLKILLLCRGHEFKADEPRYRARTRGSSPIST